jgi:hypothetical protein
MEQLDVDNAIETGCGVWIARHGEEVNDFDIGPTLQGGGGITVRVNQHTTIQQYLSNHWP